MKTPKLFKFIIPASWQVSGELKVKASSLESAIDQANIAELRKFNASFVDDSFEINQDVIESYPQNLASEEMCKIENTKPKDLPLLIGILKQPEAQKYLDEKIRSIKHG